MDVNEFQIKHSSLIDKFEEIAGKNAVWHNRITGSFKCWLNQKIKYKDGFVCDDPDCPDYGKEFSSIMSLASHKNWHNREYKENLGEINGSCYGIFFLNFINDHTYFSKNLIIGIYKDTIQPPLDDYYIINREFIKLIRHGLRFGVLEKYTRDTYKINKELVKIYIKSIRNW